MDNPVEKMDKRLWAVATAKAIRERRFDDIDANQVAHEIEWLYVTTEEIEVASRLGRILTSLLLFDYADNLTQHEWGLFRGDMIDAQLALELLFEDSPSLKALIEPAVKEQYAEVHAWVASQFTLRRDVSAICPYSVDEILSGDRSHDILPSIYH